MSGPSVPNPVKSICLAGVMALALAGSAAAQAAASASFMDGVAALDRADYAAARRVFSETAARGDAGSEFALAEMDRQGQGGPADRTTAAAWYRKAADQGNPGAAFNLGLLYEAGQGVPRSDHAAADWYAKAAARGYAGAEVRLGLLYRDGRGVARDERTARAWFSKAANQGDLGGQLRLAELAAGAYGPPTERFRAMMDKVFGAGRWRETSGYRTLAQEDALRRQGAGTVAPGERSRHSMGGPEAPGAYDVVVDGMPLQLAAARLKNAHVPLSRVVAEAAHGGQGPHLHIEPERLPVSSFRRAEPTYRRIAISTGAGGQN